MFQTLLLVSNVSLSFNFRMWMWAKSRLNYTYQVFQEGIMGINLSLFGPLIRPAKPDQNPTCSRILYFHTTYSNEHILCLRYWNHVIQRSKIINTSRTTIFMLNVKSNNFFFEGEKLNASWKMKLVSWFDEKTNGEGSILRRNLRGLEGLFYKAF